MLRPVHVAPLAVAGRRFPGRTFRSSRVYIRMIRTLAVWSRPLGPALRRSMGVDSPDPSRPSRNPRRQLFHAAPPRLRSPPRPNDAPRRTQGRCDQTREPRIPRCFRSRSAQAPKRSPQSEACREPHSSAAMRAHSAASVVGQRRERSMPILLLARERPS